MKAAKLKKHMVVLHLDKIEIALRKSKALFTLYLALITILKAGTHKNASKTYYTDLKDIYISLVASYEYDRDYSTFMRHINKLAKLNLITMGKDANKFIDIKHKHVNWKQEQIKFVKVSVERLEAIVRMNFNNNSLKVSIKNLSLTNDLKVKASNINRKYFSKVYCVTNSGEIQRLRDHSNIITDYSQYIDEQTNLAVIRDTYISSKVINPAKTYDTNGLHTTNIHLKKLNFKDFQMTIKSFHTINKARRTKGKANITIERFQEQLDQLHFLINHASFQCTKSKESYLAYHLINLETSILPDSEIANYYRFKNTGSVKAASINSYSDILDVGQKATPTFTFKNKAPLDQIIETPHPFDPMKSNQEANYKYFSKRANDLSSRQIGRAIDQVFSRYSIFGKFKHADTETLKRIGFYRYLNIELNL